MRRPLKSTTPLVGSECEVEDSNTPTELPLDTSTELSPDAQTVPSDTPTELSPDVSPNSLKFYDDGTNTFFWEAHTLTALAVIVIALVYFTIVLPTPDDTGYNLKRGVFGMIVVFILIGMIHMPDGPFIRPHPAFWRFFLCLKILYVLILIFALFQTEHDNRQFLKLYDPDLGEPLPERTYAEDCRLYTPDHPNGSFANLMDKMDVFVPSHFIGWYVKALILRDVFLLNILSIGFEMMEYTLESQLPNFGECWWDHWILDFLICNGLGIWLGMRTCEYLEMKTYHWKGLWKIPTFKGKLKRAVSQFTPYSWTHFRWGYMGSFKRFNLVVVMVSFWLLQELNTFYLKASLWIPPNHSLNFYREVLFAFCGSCATKEMYDYLSAGDKNTRIGCFTWLMFTAIMCEVLLEVKMGWDILSVPIPRVAVVFWSTLLLSFLVWTFWHFTLPFRDMPVVGKYFAALEAKLKSN